MPARGGVAPLPEPGWLRMGELRWLSLAKLEGGSGPRSGGSACPRYGWL